ncbi:hypothetical protein BN946_scf184909.g9 [Trametes cinnabarina]|uniref:NADP-dependent oxidoreductase domain-containing protein n=1 Tax=Pycnoporus cinnabarinus TaxID=5643 RepID=A0A060SAP0_PYCCI|nr:hypothetical protein BN946_scf184909.g9 [Trametes cinnabarina]
MYGLAPAPPPPIKLGRHRRLAPTAGIHVSPLCLGGMSIGDQWEKIGMGFMTKEMSFKLLDAFYEAGGNFIDTANDYQNETSEKFIGETVSIRAVLNPTSEHNETEKAMAKVLEEIAAEVGASNIQAVAIAYVMQKVPYVFPIVGGRKVEHFRGNLTAPS